MVLAQETGGLYLVHGNEPLSARKPARASTVCQLHGKAACLCLAPGWSEETAWAGDCVLIAAEMFQNFAKGLELLVEFHACLARDLFCYRCSFRQA